MSSRLTAFIVALACALAVLVGGSWASADEVSAPEPTYGDIRLRDILIIDQENLLNAYRCRFGVDVEVVLHGCRGGAPANPLPHFHELSTSDYWPRLHSLQQFRDPSLLEDDRQAPLGDLWTRERLISAQELLLNKYRCLFNIDLDAVPAECTGFLTTVVESGTVGPGTRITYMGPIDELVAPVPMDAAWVSKWNELIEVQSGLTGEEVRQGDVASEVQPLSQALFCLPEWIEDGNCKFAPSGHVAQWPWWDLVAASRLACPASDGVTIWELIQSHEAGIWMEGRDYEWARSLWLPDWLPHFQTWSTIDGNRPETQFVCYHRSDPRYVVLYLDDSCIERFIHIEVLPDNSSLKCYSTRVNTLFFTSPSDPNVQQGRKLSVIWKQRVGELHGQWCERFPEDCPPLDYLQRSIG